MLMHAGSLEAPATPGRRYGLPAQPLTAMPEQQAIIEMGQWPTGHPVGWPLGPRAQQPYPAVSVSSVGSVMQAFRGLNVHVRCHATSCHGSICRHTWHTISRGQLLSMYMS